ncbi:MAG TPA: type II toxin-antitoxin system VapC family toxin [Anaerolineales bacterium]|nr:type II toxin-antitoxin system VapC family toxin [Anaerolineales bacterium]HRQ92299.1 type II toxin-antitoxin system VapC family toxin [Anaerolineales bacterium]
MNLIDSSGWLEYLADGPNAAFFATPIKKTNQLIVPSVCIYEVFKRIHHQLGEGAALQAVSIMHEGLIIELDAELALLAAKFSLEFKLPMADSIIYAAGYANNAVIWTQDADFANLAGVKYIAKNIR